MISEDKFYVISMDYDDSWIFFKVEFNLKCSSSVYRLHGYLNKNVCCHEFLIKDTDIVLYFANYSILIFTSFDLKVFE